MAATKTRLNHMLLTIILVNILLVFNERRCFICGSVFLLFFIIN